MKRLDGPDKLVGFQQIKITDIIPTPDNPRRKINSTDPAFTELVESIKAVGILQPLLARVHPTELRKFDLRLGHRRLMAAQAAGLERVPVIVRELSDKEAMEITVVENLHREDLTPLEEADGVKGLLRVGFTVEEIAADFGKTTEWVRKRAQLEKLVPEWREFGERFGVSAAHLVLIARYSTERQQALAREWHIKEVLKKRELDWHQRCFQSAAGLAELKRNLAKETCDLALAQWNVDDATLVPAAGACTACPSRSSCNPELFDDLAEGVEGKKKRGVVDFCLKPECWKEKEKAWLEVKLAKLQAKHPDVLRVSSSYQYSGKERTVPGTEAYEVVKKDAPGARPALVVDGYGDVGKQIWVVLRGGKAGAKVAKQTGSPKDAAAALEEKRAALEKRRLAWVCQHLSEVLEKMDDLPAPAFYRKPEGLLLLVAIFGTTGDWQTRRWGAESSADYDPDADYVAALLCGDSGAEEFRAAVEMASKSDWDEAIAEADAKWSEVLQGERDAKAARDRILGGEPEAEADDAWGALAAMYAEPAVVLRAAWAQVRPRLRQELGYVQVGDLGEGHVRACERIAELVGLDYHALKQQAAAEIPEPKSWAKAAQPEEIERVEHRLPEAQGKEPDVQEKPTKAKKGRKKTA